MITEIKPAGFFFKKNAKKASGDMVSITINKGVVKFSWPLKTLKDASIIKYVRVRYENIDKLTSRFSFYDDDGSNEDAFNITKPAPGKSGKRGYLVISQPEELPLNDGIYNAPPLYGEGALTVQIKHSPYETKAKSEHDS